MKISNQSIGKKIRINLLKLTHHAKSSHLGSALSIVEILTILYNQILNSSKKNSNKINVYGNLVRDYLYIDQMSKIIINLASKNKNFGIINICSGKGISLKNLVKKICKIENSSNLTNSNKRCFNNILTNSSKYETIYKLESK